VKTKQLVFALAIAAFALGACAPTQVGSNTAGATPTAEPEPTALQSMPVHSVSVEIGVGSPIPVDAFISAELPDTCAQLAKVEMQQKDFRFEIALRVTPGTREECFRDTLPFRMYVPLNMVNQSDGAYIVEVNGASATFTWPPASTSDGSGGIQSYESQLMQALDARDFDAMRGLMGDTFLIAGWRSEGNFYAPEAAIEQLRNSGLSANAVLAFDPKQDLSALLEGADPFAFIPPDVVNPSAMFVSGWGLEGGDDAILYLADRGDGSRYWYGVLSALGGFIWQDAPASYEDHIAGVALSLKNGWRVGEALPGQSAILFWYPEGKYVGGESLQAGDAKCDLFIYPVGHTVAQEAENVRTDPANQIFVETDLTLPSGLSAITLRYSAPLAGEVARMLTSVDDRVVTLTCFGDLSLFEDIVAGVRVIQ